MPVSPTMRLVVASLLLVPFLLASCSLQNKINTLAKEQVLDIPDLQTAHIGISIFEPASGQFWYNHQADKYFVPASNTKIFTCYAGMKYLGDSIAGLQYAEDENNLYMIPTGDPSLLHPDFKQQPVIKFLQQADKNISVITTGWKEEALGSGWAWDDYNAYYSAERSALPVYGNTIKFVQTQTMEKPEGFDDKPQITIYTIPEINWKLNFNADTSARLFSVARGRNENIFTVTEGKEKLKELEIPFVTNGLQSALELLKDTIGKEIKPASQFKIHPAPGGIKFKIVHSQPTDSLFKPMMHRSDNFFAEQTLLMVSHTLLGEMNDAKITDSLLKTDLKDLPQKPSWADGSGLSRFNLFSPADFVWILNKMKNEFSWKRISTLFPTGNEGTLTNYYTTDSSFIYAKTGSLSGVIALSGYLITQKNKTLIFSVLVNNHRSAGRNVRRAVEQFLTSLRKKY